MGVSEIFKTEFKGYNRKEVIDYISSLNLQMENLKSELDRCESELEKCQSELAEKETVAQLEELNRYSKELEARAHEKSCAIASVKRELGSSDSSLNHYKRFLSEAKVKYREGETQNKWPVMIGGYSLSRDALQEKIIDAAEKISEAEQKSGSKRNLLVSLEKTLQITQNEQRRIVKVREQIQNTINDLKVKKVIDADDGIVASLNAIEDSMGVLGVNYDDPKIESIVQPDKKTTREELFKQIMAE